LAVQEIKEGLPEDLTSQLLPNEKVYYFSYISFKGGCGSSSSRQDYWISITNRRVIYKTKIQEETNKIVTRDGILPLEKVSFVEVTDIEEKGGCSTTKSFALVISTSGGAVRIPIPTKEKGYEIRRTYTQILEYLKNQNE